MMLLRSNSYYYTGLINYTECSHTSYHFEHLNETTDCLCICIQNVLRDTLKVRTKEIRNVSATKL